MQFDVHRNSSASDAYAPFLLNIQADLLDHLDSRVMVPLIAADQFGRRAHRLHPVFMIDRVEVVMATHLLAAVRTKTPGVIAGNLSSHRGMIVTAVDILWSGI